MSRREDLRVGRRRSAIDRDASAVSCVGDGGIGVLAVDHNRDRNRPRAAELEAVAARPRATPDCAEFVDASGFVGSRGVEQMCDAKRGGRIVARLRHRAEPWQIAIDKAGIDRAAPEFVGAA